MAGNTFWNPTTLTSKITAFDMPFHFRDEKKVPLNTSNMIIILRKQIPEH